MIKISEEVFKHIIMNGEDRGSTLGSYNDKPANFYKRFYDNMIFELMEIEEHEDSNNNVIPAEYYALQKSDNVVFDEEFSKATKEFIETMNKLLDDLQKDDIKEGVD